MQDLLFKSMTGYLQNKLGGGSATKDPITITRVENVSGFHGKRIIINDLNIDKEMYHKFLEQYCQVSLEDHIIFELTTLGGDLQYALLISQILMHHKGNVSVHVPKYALSGGTIIALAADEIIFSTVGSLGPIDPQYFGLSVPNYTSTFLEMQSDSFKPSNSGLGSWLWFGMKCLYQSLTKVNNDHKEFIMKMLVGKKRTNEQAEKIYNFFTHSKDHRTPIFWRDIPNTLDLNIGVDQDMLYRMYARVDKTLSKQEDKEEESDDDDTEELLEKRDHDLLQGIDIKSIFNLVKQEMKKQKDDTNIERDIKTKN